MDLVPTDEQLQMVEAVEHFLGNELSIPQLRQRLTDRRRLSRDEWRAVADMGLFSLGLPEDAGGAGCPAVEEALVFRQLGRHLAPVAFIGATVAGRLAHANREAGWLADRDEIVGGVPVAIAVARPGAATGSRVAGSFDVLDLDHAQYILVLEPAGRDVALARASSFRSQVEELSCLDPSVQLSRAHISPVPRVELATDVDGTLYLLGGLLAAAMMAGIAEVTLESGVAYAKERVQFGRPIGTNQAVKHPCADMAVRCSASTSLLFFAAIALRDRRDDMAFQVAAAKRMATEAAFGNARANVQIHGGMGYTWEHDAHLYLERTHVLDRIFGDVRDQQRQLIALAPAVP